MLQNQLKKIEQDILDWEKNRNDIVSLAQKINEIRKNTPAEKQPPYPSLKDNIKIFSNMPLVLRLINYDMNNFSNAGIYLSPHCFSGIFDDQRDTDEKNTKNQHFNINEDILRQLPRAMIDPIAIIDQSSLDEKKNLIILELKDSHNATIVMPIMFNNSNDLRQVNIVKSIFAKTDVKTGDLDYTWFMKTDTLVKMMYVNRHKTKHFSSVSGMPDMYKARLALPFTPTNILYTEEDLQMFQAAKPKHYQFKNGEIVGQITQDGARKIISLLNHSDPSTFIHESAHISLMWLEQDVREGIASHQAARDYEIVRRWVGAEGDSPISERQHQRFAEAFEAWVMKNQCPVPELSSPFERCSIWLKHLYNGAKKLELPVSEDVEEVFARLLGKDNKTNLLDADDEKLLDIEVNRICHETELAISIRGLEDAWTLDIDDGNDDEDDNFQRPGT